MQKAAPAPNHLSSIQNRHLLQRLTMLMLWLAALLLGCEFIWLFSTSRDIAWDEGYLLVKMGGFMQGHALYDEVFAQYGPSYFLLRGGLVWLTGMPLDHDATRLTTMVFWGMSALLLGLATGRLTRSVWLGWLGFAVSLVHLSALANEPGHPQEWVVLVLVGMATATALWPGMQRGWYPLAALAAVVATIKINIGAFVVLGLGLHALAASQRVQPGAAWWCAALLGLLPALLMARHLGQPWAIVYASCAGVAIFCVAASALLRSSTRREQRVPLLRCALVFGAVCTTSLVAALLLGTSLAGLIHGVLIGPLGLAGAFSIPLPVSKIALPSAAAALAVFMLFSHRGSTDVRVLGTLKLLFGLLGAIVLTGTTGVQLLYLAPWIWVALWPDHEVPSASADPDDQRRCKDSRRATRLLGALAAFQLMHAYPVAGSQVAWATLLMIPLYLQSLRDGARMLGARLEAAPAGVPTEGNKTLPILAWWRHPLGPPSARALGGAAALVLFIHVWTGLPELRQRRATLAPIDLPGTHLVHLDPQAVALYRGLTGYLQTECDGFTSYPGFHSLHLWTGIAPPTLHNVTDWDLLDDTQEREVIAALERLQNPRIVMTRDYFTPWRALDPEQLSPFARHALENYVEVARIGSIRILGRKPKTDATIRP